MTMTQSEAVCSDDGSVDEALVALQVVRSSLPATDTLSALVSREKQERVTRGRHKKELERQPMRVPTETRATLLSLQRTGRPAADHSD